MDSLLTPEIQEEANRLRIRSLEICDTKDYQLTIMLNPAFRVLTAAFQQASGLPCRSEWEAAQYLGFAYSIAAATMAAMED